MKKITIIALSFLLFASGISQAQKVKYPTRKGIVQESTMIIDKNGKPKKKPLQGVRIFTGKGVSNSSNAKGEFTLTPDTVPFKITQVKKNEYTLLSPEQGTRTYQDNNEILDVLMVNDKTFNNYMDSQMEIARLKREAKKNDELKKIEQQKDEGKIKYGEYLQKKDSINQAYDEQMKRLVEFVERSCKEFFKGMEQIDKEIDDCIMKGDYLKADSLLISKGYFNERIKNIEKLKQVTEQYIEDAVSDCWKYADINLDKVNYTNALLYLDTARVLQEKYLEPLHPDLATTYNNIGFVYLWQNYNDEALKWFDKALEIQEKVLDPLSPALATSYNNKGIVYINKNKDEEALNLIDKALQIAEQVFDPLSPDLVLIYNSKGNIYFKQNKNDEALKWYNKALNIQEQIPDSLNYYLATLYNNIGNVYFSQGNYEETLIFFDKALYIYEQVSDTFSAYLACTYGNKGLVYFQLGNYDEALKWQAKALRIEELVLDSLSQILAESYFEIGDTYFEMKNYNKALEYYKKALFIYDENYEGYSLSYYLLRLKIKECKQALGE